MEWSTRLRWRHVRQLRASRPTNCFKDFFSAVNWKLRSWTLSTVLEYIYSVTSQHRSELSDSLRSQRPDHLLVWTLSALRVLTETTEFTVSAPAHQHMNGRPPPPCQLDGRKEVFLEYLSESSWSRRSFGQRKFLRVWSPFERVRMLQTSPSLWLTLG